MVSNRASWTNPRILITLFLVFLVGGLVGAWTMRQYHRRVHEQQAIPQLSYDQLNQELKLSPDQSLKLKSILDDFVRYNDDIQAQIDDFRATGKNRIRSILNPAQQARFEKLCDGVQSR